jgi:hypothetical protein
VAPNKRPSKRTETRLDPRRSVGEKLGYVFPVRIVPATRYIGAAEFSRRLGAGHHSHCPRYPYRATPARTPLPPPLPGGVFVRSNVCRSKAAGRAVEVVAGDAISNGYVGARNLQHAADDGVPSFVNSYMRSKVYALVRAHHRITGMISESI